MELLRTVFVLLSVQNCVHSANYSSDIDIIVDFLETDPCKNMAVTAYVCWKKEYKIKLFKKLLEYNYSTSILNVNENLMENVYPNYKQTYLLDLDCEKYLNILLKANDLLLFHSTITWLLVTKNPMILDEISLNFEPLNIFEDTNIILFQKLLAEKYLVREIYKPNKNKSKVITNVISLWRKKDKFGNYKNRIIANERLNLNKVNLGASIVILENDTLNHLDDYRFNHIDSITKVNYVFVKHLIDFLNASLTVYPVDSWGYINKTSRKYTGMIGSMQKNESEIGGTALFMTTERIPLIDYLAMTTDTKIRFVFRQPPLSYEQNIFTLPFTRGLWISSFALVAIIILVLYYTVFLEWKQNNLEEESGALRASFFDVVMLTFAAVAQQGSTTEPKSGAGKMIMILTFIALMFLYVSYSANIVALLQSSATNIRTLDDLLESRLKLGADDTVYNRYYMSIATDSIRKALYERKIAPLGQNPHFITMEEGVRRMREGFYAFHMETGRGYKLVADTFYEQEKCGIQEINFLDVVDTYFSVKKNSTLKEMITLGLRRLRESGIQNRELTKIYTKKPECHSAGGNFVSVGLIDSYPAFLFLGAGVGISLLLLILENIFNKNVNGRNFCVKIYK